MSGCSATHLGVWGGLGFEALGRCALEAWVFVFGFRGSSSDQNHGPYLVLAL